MNAVAGTKFARRGVVAVIGAAAVILLVLTLVGARVLDFFAIDACLDDGGRWNDVAHSCERTDASKCERPR